MTTRAGFGWYLRRMRAMSAREAMWRLRRRLHPQPRPLAPAELLVTSGTTTGWDEALARFRSAADRPVVLGRDRARTIADDHPELVGAVMAAADSAVRGRFQFFGYPPVDLARPIEWNRDPLTGYRWPPAAGHRIDHRNAPADVKWIWELNRLQHLPWLAQAWLFSGEDRYVRTLLGDVDSWIEQNPAGRGIAWRDGLEVGVRAISVAVALQGIRDSPQLDAHRFRRVVQTLAAGATFCWSARSRFSSANNHLLGEMAGLAAVAMFFPELRHATRWEAQSLGALCTEAGRQILPDGAGAEQAIGYHLEAAEYFHFIAAMLRDRDGSAPDALTDAIRRSSRYLSALVGTSDPDPRYGDDDQGFVLRLGPETSRTVRDHLAIVDTDGGRAVTEPVNTSAVWFAAMRSARGDVPAPRPDPVPSSFHAESGGLVVIRRGGWRLTMDTGPLGYLSLAAHGHADALALTLSSDGEDLICDPGTASYYGHPGWRTAMRGTRAHATVCVDDADQSVIGGPFLWSRHANVRVRGVDLDAGIVDAEHDGYRRLPGRVTHRRWLVAPPTDRSALVVDLISGGGSHRITTSWPLHPRLTARAVESGHTVLDNGHPCLRLQYAGTAPIQTADVCGDDDAGGWWSDRLESRIPAWWLSTHCAAHLPVASATLITPADAGEPEQLRIALGPDTITVRWLDDGRPRRVSLSIGNDAAVSVS